MFHAHLEYSSTLYSLRDPGYRRLYHLEHWAEKGKGHHSVLDAYQGFLTGRRGTRRQGGEESEAMQ